MRPLLLVVLLGLVGTTVRADEKTTPPSKPSEAEPPASPCIDDVHRLGVQEKTFLRRHRLELVPQGGLYASDLLSTTYAVGGTVDFYLAEDLAVETSLHLTPIALQIDSSLSKFLGEPPIFKEGKALLLMGGLLWSPIHFKVKTAGGGIRHGDFEFGVSAGKLFNDTAQGLAMSGGLAMELYLTRWLSFRLDLRDVLLIQEAVDDTRLTNNITALVGLGVWIPFGF
jgi:outer membrane beta-barrel protein